MGDSPVSLILAARMLHDDNLTHHSRCDKPSVVSRIESAWAKVCAAASVGFVAISTWRREPAPRSLTYGFLAANLTIQFLIV